MAVSRRDDKSGNGDAGQHLADGGPFTFARAGGLQACSGERENRSSSQNHCFHNFTFR
jgi:hypothetical protein